jgi:GNAT superfamily N-acetyltransferase
MSTVRIEPLTAERFEEFYRLVCALAEYERLSPPDDAARQRLYRDGFEHTPPRYEALLAMVDSTACGYCMFFETYSSFRAAPTLFLEDIFVLPQWRFRGIGHAMMRHLARIAVERGCQRMEWLVLDWNEPAHRFYRTIGAERLVQWQLYRLSDDNLARLADESA